MTVSAPEFNAVLRHAKAYPSQAGPIHYVKELNMVDDAIMDDRTENRSASAMHVTGHVLLVNLFTPKPGMADDFIAAQTAEYVRLQGLVVGWIGNRLGRAVDGSGQLVMSRCSTVWRTITRGGTASCSPITSRSSGRSSRRRPRACMKCSTARVNSKAVWSRTASHPPVER